jgi:hypothetical protein
MKKVLSVSLGSSTRDHTTEAEFLGQHFWLSRQGTDGDFDRCVQLYEEYDGKVDAFGVGGTEFYLWVNGRRYYFREVKRIRHAIKISKVGDGNGIKHLLAPMAIEALKKHGYDLHGKKALKTTAVDRYTYTQPPHCTHYCGSASSDYDATSISLALPCGCRTGERAIHEVQSFL